MKCNNCKFYKTCKSYKKDGKCPTINTSEILWGNNYGNEVFWD